MPVHSLIITNTSGHVLFSRFYDEEILATEGNSISPSIDDYNDRLFVSLLPGAVNFERYLFKHTRAYWQRCQLPQSVTFLNTHALFQILNSDMIVFVCGKDDVDELICKIDIFCSK